ncbi:MAG: OB-fold nucleic acid binding domain-containing protein, partial [Flavobacteriales bacterium]|nr:OB-fold nucleic acid binding domain-containing protein [Flavobacteriales bacterium]
MDSKTQARTRISLLLNTTHVGQTVRVCGWVRTFRNDRFLALNDGSTLNNLQLVVDKDATAPEVLKQLHTGAAVEAVGELVESQGGGQATELKVETLTVLGSADPEEFPIQMKRHSLEFLREKAHLRFRTNTFAAVFRVRHTLQYAVHSFFHERGFYQLHTPIITGSDAEAQV